MAATLDGSAPVGTTIVARRPSFPAAYATAAPWLPVDAAMTPRRRASAPSARSLLNAPLVLKDPVCWVFSSLR